MNKYLYILFFLIINFGFTDRNDYTPAKFVGGEQELNKFLVSNLKYPKEAIKLKLEGTVYTQFVIEKSGKVKDEKIVGNIRYGHGLEKEALRVVKMMPNWIPAKSKNKNVRSFMQLPIVFKLK